MVRWFETRLAPTAPPQGGPPPRGLIAFYWHFARQAKGLFAALFVAGLAVAVLDTLVPVFMGRLVALASSSGTAPDWSAIGGELAAMAAVMLVGRPLAILTQNLLTNQAIAANLTSLTRWQAHWHLVRQSWSFFQSDFAGRLANRVIQTGGALRESLVQLVQSVWYMLVYGVAAIVWLGRIDPALAVPLAIWAVVYVTLLRGFVPRMRDRSKTQSETRSWLIGRIVDTYTNIQTVKLFARPADEDGYIRAAIDAHTGTVQAMLRLQTGFGLLLSTLNAALLVATAASGLWLWQAGAISGASLATALPLVWQIVNIAGWVAFMVTGIFENVGVVQEGMQTIAQPIDMPDPPQAASLVVGRGAIRFERVDFAYGRRSGVIHDLSLTIAPGERVGLVGPSGAGKSTLVNLLLGFFRPEAGRILVDDQDIARVTQASLRAQIAVVTQDTSLMHRSIAENIRYGRPEASDAEVESAARRAHAHDFIAALEDWKGRRGYDAHVGERGVKLSGGQRQRIAIARVILKDAPILILDEATSALDSEVEAAIQEQLAGLMEGKTVIAIAHRLSTIARMDRLVVLDGGRIVETGSHAGLLATGGPYARLWQRQSGGFIGDAAPK
ncbi:MAG: ABC transporter ATP-binding protein [Alphaproteobacteria bacterium]|nr:ABC transporter ATP-binding protein [Alphaproteobacteria bacterium]